MDRRLPALVAALVAIALVAWGPLRVRGEQTVSAIAGPSFPTVSAATDAATFTFDASVNALNRQAFLLAVSRMRPEAVALAGRVDGLVTVEDGDPPSGALGLTTSRHSGYTIRMRFGAVFQQLGQRGFDRVIHHELAHVVDHAMLTEDLRRTLDAGVPPGRPCEAGGHTGACAPREERFAESFAKWATGDLGVSIYAGYAVPPPPDLEAWGRPLAALAVRSTATP
jgi:hypothetical protein